MYTISEEIQGQVMGLRIRGEVTARETRQLTAQIDKRSARWGALHLLVVMDSYPSFNSAESFCEDLRFAKLAADKIVRIAVVGAEPWKDTWTALFGLFGGLEMNYFQKTAIDQAWQWLTTGNA